LQSLCRECHQGKWADDRLGYSCDIGDDGFPTDANHPFNRGVVGSGAIRRPER
jgi:hypothetical protein